MRAPRADPNQFSHKQKESGGGDRQSVPELIDLNWAGPNLQVAFRGGNAGAANRAPASRRRRQERIPMARALGVDAEWMETFDFWLAQYLPGQAKQKKTHQNPNPPPKPNLKDWKELDKHWPKGDFFPSAPLGGSRPKIWQWTGDFYIMPGLGDETLKGAPLDMNFFNGDLNELRKWAGLPDADGNDLGFSLGSDKGQKIARA